MNSGQTPPKKSGFSAPKLPKPVMLLVISLAVLIVGLIFVAVLSSTGKLNSQPYVDVLSRSKEIIRVNDLAKEKMKDTDTLALLTTTSAALTSEQADINSYLGSAGAAVDPNLLGGYQNSDTDKGLEKAAQNNNLEDTYTIYLKGSLGGYLEALRSAHQGASSDAKLILGEAIVSTQILLTAPQFN